MASGNPDFTRAAAEPCLGGTQLDALLQQARTGANRCPGSPEILALGASVSQRHGFT